MTDQTPGSDPLRQGAPDLAVGVPSYDSAETESPILREARDLVRYRDLLELRRRQ